jgi:hypothetical protein
MTANQDTRDLRPRAPNLLLRLRLVSVFMAFRPFQPSLKPPAFAPGPNPHQLTVTLLFLYLGGIVGTGRAVVNKAGAIVTH